MILGYHGGKCCGVKTIYGFPSDPNSNVIALDVPMPECWGRDRMGHPVSTDEPFFYGEAPIETALKRLDRYIAFLAKHRPSGIVEIVLADHPFTYPNNPALAKQAYHWIEPLKERGFRETVSGLNSNSNRICRIFHMVMEGGVPKKD